MSQHKSAWRVLVTPASFGKSDPQLREALAAAVSEVIYNDLGRPLKSEEVREMVRGCDGYIAGLDTIDRNALEGADRLKVISRYGVGVDKVDLAGAAERGIVVTNTPDANATSVAELTIGLMLAAARAIPQLHTEVRAGSWPRKTAITLEGKTVGLIGLGAIGKQVARSLQGWDVRVLGYDPAVDTATARSHGVEWTQLEQLISESDFVSLHVPVLNSTRGMVNADFLSRMKSTAYLINTARGEIVDETALATALEMDKLRGAALDALTEEPPSPENRLLNFPNVIVTPHCGAHTDRAMHNMGWMALHDCLAVLRGELPAHPVLPSGACAHA